MIIEKRKKQEMGLLFWIGVFIVLGGCIIGFGTNETSLKDLFYPLIMILIGVLMIKSTEYKIQFLKKQEGEEK